MPIGITIIESAVSAVSSRSPVFDTVYFLTLSTATANVNNPVAVSVATDFTANFPGAPSGDVASFGYLVANAPPLNAAASSGSPVAKCFGINCNDGATADPLSVNHYVFALNALKKRTDLTLGILLIPHISEYNQADRTTLFSAVESFCQSTDWVFFFNFSTGATTPAQALTERALYVSPYGHSSAYYDWIITSSATTVGASVAAVAIALQSSLKVSPYAPPAGTGFPLAAVGSVSTYVYDRTIFDSLRQANINVIQRIPVYGYCLWGARTLASQAKFGQINTRLAISLIATQLTNRLTPYLFAGADPQGVTAREVLRIATAIMERAWVEGGLSGVSSDAAYKVVQTFDTVTNTDLTKIQIKIYARFIGTLEQIEITIVNVDLIPA